MQGSSSFWFAVFGIEDIQGVEFADSVPKELPPTSGPLDNEQVAAKKRPNTALDAMACVNCAWAKEATTLQGRRLPYLRGEGLASGKD